MVVDVVVLVDVVVEVVLVDVDVLVELVVVVELVVLAVLVGGVVVLIELDVVAGAGSEGAVAAAPGSLLHDANSPTMTAGTTHLLTSDTAP